MGLIAIEVKAECDRCGKLFIVEIDPDEIIAESDNCVTIPAFDMAIEAIENGHEKGDILAPTSMYGSEMLCSECTELRHSLDEHRSGLEGWQMIKEKS